MTYYCFLNRRVSRLRATPRLRSTAIDTHLATLSPIPRFKSLPRITFSVKKQDLKPEEALNLLEVSCPRTDGFSPMAAQQFSHWTGRKNALMMNKMTVALDRCQAVVAAFANVDLYNEFPSTGPHRMKYHDLSAIPIGEDNQSRSDSNGGGHTNTLWSLRLPPLIRAPKDQRCLVGMGRATGDSALTAQLYDIAVHPSLRGFGIGKQLVQLLVHQIKSRGVYDIGLVCPPETQSFFDSCCFGQDPEGSTFMTYGGSDFRKSIGRRRHHSELQLFRQDQRQDDRMHEDLTNSNCRTNQGLNYDSSYKDVSELANLEYHTSCSTYASSLEGHNATLEACLPKCIQLSDSIGHEAAMSIGGIITKGMSEGRGAAEEIGVSCRSLSPPNVSSHHVEIDSCRLLSNQPATARVATCLNEEHQTIEALLTKKLLEALSINKSNLNQNDSARKDRLKDSWLGLEEHDHDSRYLRVLPEIQGGTDIAPASPLKGALCYDI